MQKEFEYKWEKCLSIIRDLVGDDRFETWFSCAKAIDYSNGTLTISLPSQYFCEVYEGTEFYDYIFSSLRRVFGPDVRLVYDVPVIANDAHSNVAIMSPQQSHVLRNKVAVASQQPMDPFGKVQYADFDPQLNPQYNFENYCVGESNKLPHAIAEAIANNPKNNDFNPFFLYGPVGVGKTHLIQAIGIRIKERLPQSKVLFTTLLQFQQMYAEAARDRKIPDFINWFQHIDVLLIDDIQELSNKIGTMNGLFPIFNQLQMTGRKIIFTCDRPPMELDGITDRLIDRFRWGVTEKLPKPDKELRKKILKFKAAKSGIDLTDEVIDIVAEHATESVRELENVVRGVIARCIALNAPITPALVLEEMKHTVRKDKRAINFDMIVDTTADYFNLNPDAIFSKSKVRDIADARQLIMYLAGKHTQLSTPAIGRKLNRTHTTVLHGMSVVADRLPYSKELMQAVECIEKELKV